LDAKLHHISIIRSSQEPDVLVFMREYGDHSVAFIDSLILDVKNDVFDFKPKPDKACVGPKKGLTVTSKRILIVHGHDESMKIEIARFVEKLGYEAVILHEQASSGMTIIEKIEATDVGFAIVLYTPDDKGNEKEKANAGELNYRARQNVVFEHGILISRLGRARVVPLVKGDVELPSDMSGIVYVDDKNWKLDIAKEMKSAGYKVNLDKII
jgi:predicted nucleotide-binding protein